MRSIGVRLVAIGAAVIAVGCAEHQPKTIAERFVVRDTGRDNQQQPPSADENAALAPALAKEIAEVRQLAAAHRPAREHDARLVEQSDPDLLAARLALTTAPTAANHRLVAESYARLGVLDAAYDHFTAALKLSRHDAAAFDGRARVWRDWGFAPMGLSDAYQAIYLAPRSAVPQNTLGTLLLKMGLLSDARQAFERATLLDPSAAYAVANLERVRELQSRLRSEGGQ